MSKSIFESKTFWVNLLSAFVGAFEAGTGLLSTHVPDPYFTGLVVAVFIANIALRTVTRTAVHIGKRQHER